MASIEYGIDGYGRKIYAKEAYSGRTYTCPYCSEEIHVRKCYDRDDYFAHRSISNRTPQQMICPGYTGKGAYKRIEGTVDKVFITNGGLPLYLCAYDSSRYQLSAYFPPLRQENMKLLDDWGVKVIVSEYGKQEEYSVNNLRYYRVKTTADWIKVKCSNMKYSILEVQQKWEWGIRGLDCDKDIFHSHYDGGYRVALHSNIVVGKEYLIVKGNENFPTVKKVEFHRKGILKFTNLYGKREYYVFSMKIISANQDTIAYIQNKGYQLIEQNDEIIPMWPPAVIEGKELIYRSKENKAFLYHDKRSEQRIFNVSDYGLSAITENDDVFETITDDKTLILSDYQFNSYSNEIRFMLTQTRDNFEKENLFVPSVFWKGEDTETRSISSEQEKIYKEKKIIVSSEIDLDLCVLQKNYLKISSKRIVENLKGNQKLVIDLGMYGKIWIEKEDNKNLQNLENNVDIDNYIKVIRCCKSIEVPINNEFLDIFEYAKKNSKELYKIMYQWFLKKRMPAGAIKYMYRIKENIINEQSGYGNIG